MRIEALHARIEFQIIAITFARLFQESEMAWVQQFKTPVGEHNAAPVAFLAAKPQNRFFKRQYLWMQRNSMKARTITALAFNGKLVYHAGQAPRSRAGLTR